MSGTFNLMVTIAELYGVAGHIGESPSTGLRVHRTGQPELDAAQLPDDGVIFYSLKPQQAEANRWQLERPQNWE
jgi:hypothetical protein